MNIILNGNNKSIDDIGSVEELIRGFFEDSRGIIVELNGEIIRREQWGERSLKEGDVVELIQFMGGG